MDEYIPTGITGADKILGEKGVPRGHSILLAGGPGSGKTTFAMQFLYKGVTEYDEPGLYISLDEVGSAGSKTQVIKLLMSKPRPKRISELIDWGLGSSGLSVSSLPTSLWFRYPKLPWIDHPSSGNVVFRK